MDELTVERWDGAAADYQKVFKLGQNEYNDAVFAFWEGEGMLRPGARVLDIGCGVGKYGVLFAERGCDVTLTDLSPEMLRHAQANMARFDTPWRTFCCDFSQVTGREEVFSGGFDFSISTMSPAVCDADTVKKMSDLTRGWCFLSRFCQWRQPLRDALMERAGLAPRSGFGDLEADCAAMVRAVSDAGWRPQLRRVDYDWRDLRSPEEMADYLLRHYPGTEEKRAALLDAARSLSGGDGLLRDEVFTKVAWIWWNTEA